MGEEGGQREVWLAGRKAGEQGVHGGKVERSGEGRGDEEGAVGNGGQEYIHLEDVGENQTSVGEDRMMRHDAQGVLNARR